MKLLDKTDPTRMRTTSRVVEIALLAYKLTGVTNFGTTKVHDIISALEFLTRSGYHSKTVTDSRNIIFTLFYFIYFFFYYSGQICHHKRQKTEIGGTTAS